MASESLEVILRLQAGQYKREAREAATATGRIAGESDRATTATGRLSQKFESLSGMAKVKLAAGLAAAGAAFLQFMKESSQAASALNESINAVNQIFGEASEQVLEFGRIASQVAGLSAREFNQLATNTGALLTNMGFSMDAAGKESIRLSMRAADLASIFDKDVAQALEAINSGLRGETEPLRQFGITLSDAAIRSKAVEMGLARTTSEVDTHGKAVAALELIYEQSAAAAGDFIRTSDDVANAARVLAAEYENTQAAFGQSTLGAKNFFTAAASDFLGLVNVTGLFGKEAKEAQKQAWLLEDAIWNIKESIKDSEDPYTALADGLLHIARGGELTTAQFEALAIAAGLGEDQFEDFGRVVLEQARNMGLSEELLAELEEAITGAGAAADNAAGGVDEFGGSMKQSADETERQVDLLRDLADELNAQTSPVFRALKSWQAYQETLKKVDEDGKRTAAEILELGEAGVDAALAFAEFDDENLTDVMLAIADATGEPLERIREVLVELGILTGQEWAVDVLFNVGTRRGVRQTREQILAEILSGGEIVTSGPQARAHGGPVSAGVPYLVGERGPEMFIPAQSGFVANNQDTRRMGGDNYVINVTVPAGQSKDIPAAVAREIEAALDRRKREVA